MAQFVVVEVTFPDLPVMPTETIECRPLTQDKTNSPERGAITFPSIPCALTAVAEVHSVICVNGREVHCFENA